MAFKLSVISKDPDGVAQVAAYGEATARDFPSSEHLHFDAVLGGDWSTRRVALDMDAVPYLDSCAIGWLINVQKHFRQGGGYLTLHSVQPHVRNILNLLKIERVVPIANDVAGACAMLKARAAAGQAA